ncbi:MAG TPA: SMC-Scp complex subunit ScpB [Nitrospirales bacterium]|nr:SMC-Scp complex subunit ScpB [Nitrospirales bacterium]
MSENHTPKMQTQDLKAIVESLLFVSSEPMPLKQIGQMIDGVPLGDIQSAIQFIQEECDTPGRGIQCVEVAGGFIFTTQPDCGPWVKRLVAGKPKLSKSGLEVLAIVAYKQPITRPEIEAVRGTDTAGVMRTLLERRLVRILGRREGVGRPVIYGTTNDFLKTFGLNNLNDLPPIQELPQPALGAQTRQPQQQVVNFD